MDNQNNNIAENKDETQSQYEKYTIAVMGASAVGKTFFWASYFYSTIRNGESENVPAITGNLKHIEKLIDKIYVDHEKVMGDEKATDISFILDSKNMEIDLQDIKGGNSIDVDNWAKNEIMPRLQKADGIMIFISSKDIVENKLSKEYIAFTRAISEIRQSQDGKWQNRADIPVWFIFTKGDKVEVDQKILMDNIRALSIAAKATKDPSKVDFYDSFFEKGKNVKGFKVSAVGNVKWEDEIEDAKVPENAKQSNIVQAMDELYEAMYKARHAHNKKLTTIAAVVAALVLGGLFLADISYQKGIISNLEKNVDFSLSSPNFNKESYEQIKSNILKARNRFVIPEFLRNSEKIDLLNNKVEERLESFCYDKIKPGLDVDTNKIPTDEIAKLSKEVKEYLAYTDFSKINSEHYNKVKNVSRYFDFAVKLKKANDKLSKTSEDSADNAYILLNNWLLDINGLPTEWLDELSITTSNLVHSWGEKITSDLSSIDYDKNIEKAEALSSNPKIPDEIKKDINNYKEKWNNNKASLLESVFNNVLQEIKENNNDSEMAIEKLNNFILTHTNCSDSLKNRIKDIINEYYKSLVDNKLANTNITIDELRNLKQTYLDIPDDLKEKIDLRIEKLINNIIESVLTGIDKSNSFDELNNAIYDAEDTLKLYPEAKSPLTDSIFAKLQVLNEQKINEIDLKVNSYISDHAYKDAFNYINNEYEKENNIITGYRKDIDNKVDNITRNNNSKKGTFIDKILDSEYNYCKTVFDDNKSYGGPYNIQNVLNVLKDYQTRIKDSNKIVEINSVITYLNSIKNGFTGTLTIEEGDYTAAASNISAADIEITVESSKNSKYSCKMDNQNKPNFNDSRAFIWSSDMGNVKFTAIERDPLTNDQVFEYTINVNGFFGYENLTQKIESNSVTQKIRFTHNLPKCPWR